MFLDEIVAHKKAELARRQGELPLSALEEMALAQPPPRDFVAALKRNGVALIAEIKRASPSKGLLCPHFDPMALARCYEMNGAAAISVLTESRYFQGSIEHLAEVKREASLPVLRKDFIFDLYQVAEARAYGADAILLVVAILPDSKLAELLEAAHGLGMACLVEVHGEEELARAVATGATIIGINNRDLRTFRVDLATTQRLRQRVPPGRLVVSESGVHGPEDVRELRRWGVDAMLVGEALVTAKDVGAKVRELVEA